MASPGFSGDSFKTATAIDATDPDSATKWGKLDVYEYAEGAVAPYAGNRKIFFGKPLGFEFEKLPKGKECRVTATFLSDTDRTVSLDFNGANFEDQLNKEKFEVTLHKGQPVTKSWDVPAAKLADGSLNVVVNCIEGPNAIIQRLEISTVDGKPLAAKARKRFEDVTDEDLEKMVMPLPRISPRPSSVEGVQIPLVSLNGEWEFSEKNDGTFKPIKVPGEWTMQGFNVPQGEFAAYRRKVNIPADWKGRNVRLRFDAVHSVCNVYVNGKEVGGHIGGFVPFEMDVTSAIKPGENLMEVKVQSESPSDAFASLSSYASHQVGGLIRKVTLFALPEVHVASENTWTTLDASCKNAVFHYDSELINTGSGKTKIKLKLSLKDKDGREVSTAVREENLASGEKKAVSAELPVTDASLWTPETPNLYTLSCEVEAGGKKMGSHDVEVGLRQIEIKGNQLFVNGIPVKLLGICRHEVHPLTGRSISPELCHRDAELYKEANVTLVRTSHYPPSEEFLKACDELGIFVEVEAAFCWVGMFNETWAKWSAINPDYFPAFLEGNLDNLAASRNHPSIVFWSMANESAWSHLWKKVLQVMKRYEKSRPIAFHDWYRPGVDKPGDQPDLANCHYPSEANPDSWSQEKRPTWFGEYAHLQCYNRVEMATDPYIQEDWSRPLQRMVDLIWEQPGCLGGAIWSGIDDVFHLPDGNLCGYGHWGPIDGWRRCKPEFHGMRMAYTPVRFFSTEAEAGKPMKMNIQNRQNFLDMKNNLIEWWAGGKSGKVEMTLAPHAKGVLTLPAFPAGETVSVSVKSPGGREIAREVVQIPGNVKKTSSSGSKSFSLSYDKAKNVLVSSHGEAISLPVPMVLAVNGAGGTKMTNTVVPDTKVGEWTWSLADSEGGICRFNGSGKLGEGTMTLTPQNNGKLLVSYKIKVADNVNPRQWGMVFTLPREFDAVRWDRKSHWSWYPEDHIGRPQGSAKANPVDREFIEEPGVEPKELWKDYSNGMGSNDFRSSKENIVKASLSNGQIAFAVTPADSVKKPQTFRPWVDGKTVKVLVAGFNTGGADRFFNTHYSAERRPLKAGETFESEFSVEMESASSSK